MTGAKFTSHVLLNCCENKCKACLGLDLLYRCEDRGRIHSGVRTSDLIDDRCQVHLDLALLKSCKNRRSVYIDLDLLYRCEDRGKFALVCAFRIASMTDAKSTRASFC